MIKPFEMNDLGFFEPNEFSHPAQVLESLRNKSMNVMSMWHKGQVVAIVCFRNYWGRNWEGFFLISKHFPARCALELRDYIQDNMLILDALRLQTDSQACKILDKWHRFLGFKWEGCRKKYLFGKDFNLWAIVRGGK